MIFFIKKHMMVVGGIFIFLPLTYAGPSGGTGPSGGGAFRKLPSHRMGLFKVNPKPAPGHEISRQKNLPVPVNSPAMKRMRATTVEFVLRKFSRELEEHYQTNRPRLEAAVAEFSSFLHKGADSELKDIERELAKAELYQPRTEEQLREAALKIVSLDLGERCFTYVAFNGFFVRARYRVDHVDFYDLSREVELALTDGFFDMSTPQEIAPVLSEEAAKDALRLIKELIAIGGRGDLMDQAPAILDNLRNQPQLYRVETYMKLLQLRDETPEQWVKQAIRAVNRIEAFIQGQLLSK